MDRRLSVAAAVLLTVVAGCVQPPQTPLDPTAEEIARLIGEPIVQDHDHEDLALHNASFGLSLVGHTFGYDGEPPEGVGFGEVAWHQGWVYLCRIGAEGGFVVIDARDPAAPQPVGAMQGLGCFDIKTDKTGDTVFWAQQRNNLRELPMQLAGSADYSPRGVLVADVSDRASPRMTGYFPLPVNGVHTVRYYCYEDAGADPLAPCAGREVLFVQTYDLLATPLNMQELAPLGGVLTQLYDDAPVTQRLHILEIEREADGAVRFTPLATIQERELPAAGSGLGFRPHDSYPTKHPITGDHVLYVAYWDLGVLTYEINDPANPRLISKYQDFAPSAVAQMHFAMPSPTLIDDKVVLVAEPELPSAPASGQITFVDQTDPTQPAKLGWWKIPGELIIDAPFRFSPHNFNVANERVYIAHNHGGVWAIDIADPTSPTSAAFYQPHVPLSRAYEGRIYSAFYHDGLVYASDGATGLHILHYEKDPWPAGAYLAASWTPPAVTAT